MDGIDDAAKAAMREAQRRALFGVCRRGMIGHLTDPALSATPFKWANRTKRSS
jgi:hypothetical protein